MDPFNWDIAKFWLDAFQWIFTFIIAAVVWVRTGRNQNREIITELDVRVTELDRRVISTEERLSHAPTHEDIAKLQTQVATLEGKLDRVTQTLDRIAEYLLNKG